MKLKVLMASVVVALILALSAGASNATTVTFTITSDEPTITFEVPLSPMPDSSTAGISFTLNDILVSANGSPAGTDGFTFYNQLGDGGGLTDNTYFTGSGIFANQLYIGTEASPTFALGTYQGTYTGDRGVDPDATIVISSTPLPSTWLMLLSGLVGLGFLGYREAKKSSVVATA